MINKQCNKSWMNQIFLGMITLPFNMVSNTPVECTIDPNHPSNKNITLLDGPLVSQKLWDFEMELINHIFELFVALGKVFIGFPSDSQVESRITKQNVEF